MGRLHSCILAALMACVFLFTGAAAVPAQAAEGERPPAPDATPAPEAPPAAQVPETLILPAEEEGWREAYLAFLDENYDIFAALWPEGVSGLGFIDLDLDGTPELVVFDQGASATLGAHLFDLVDGVVYCVASDLDSAAGAFGETYFHPVGICASFFQSFRLSRTEDGWCFWVDSANGTAETAWDEFIRFDSDGGVLAPRAVCSRYLENDAETGLVEAEEYTVDGESADRDAYETVADRLMEGADVGYEARGVFLWNDLDTYSAPYDGFVAMAEAAADAYMPITEMTTLVSQAE